MISDILIETFNYLQANYDGQELNLAKKSVLGLVVVDHFNYQAQLPCDYTYVTIQEKLATLNEKESNRKSKGVYYTPIDVVRYIVINSINAMYETKRGLSLSSSELSKSIPYLSFATKKTVIDPTCGAGEFLLAMLELKFNLLKRHYANVPEGMILKTVATIYGNDINFESTTISKIRLFLCAVQYFGVKKCLKVVQILNSNFTNNDFVTSKPEFNNQFDLFVGNPPYVEDGKSGLNPSTKYGNIYANVLINSAALLKEGGVMGYVIPLSYVSTPRMGQLRYELMREVPKQYILNYSDRPDCLFKSVHQKLCIFIGAKRLNDHAIYTSHYQFWYKAERDDLFCRTTIVRNNFGSYYFIPKLGTEFDISIYKKIGLQTTALIDFCGWGKENVYLNMRAAFWIKAFRTFHYGSEYKKFSFDDGGKANYFMCLVNSSLFWWYWICVSDCWHITNKELTGFKAPAVFDDGKVKELATALENTLETTKSYVGTKQTEYEYKHKYCLDEISAIDNYINEIFGLSKKESDYIKNFAFKYRIGGGIDESN